MEGRGSLPSQNDNHECDVDIGPFIEKIKCMISCGLGGRHNIHINRICSIYEESREYNDESSEFAVSLGGWQKVGYHNQILAF